MAYRSKVALVYLLGFALDLLNMFVASIAYPDIAGQMQASVTQLAWITNAYMLGLTLIIPLSVWLVARFGERRLILASLLLFGFGSALVAQAGSIESLIGWRLLQGLGGGLLLPVGQALAYRQFAPSQRAHFTGVVLLVALMVPALSPAAGGLIVQALSWRWIFYLNLPVALLAFGLGLFWLKPDQPSAERPTLDARGLLLAATALSLLLIAVSLVSETDTRIPGLFTLALSFLALCIYLRDGWRKPDAILELQLIKNPSLRLAMLIYLCVPGVFTGTHMIAVLYLHNLGLGAAQIGALMLPWAVGFGRGDHARKTQLQPSRAQAVAECRHAFAMPRYRLADAHRTTRQHAADHRLRPDGPGRQPVQRQRADIGVCRYHTRKNGPLQCLVEHQSSARFLPRRGVAQLLVGGFGW